MKTSIPTIKFFMVIAAFVSVILVLILIDLSAYINLASYLFVIPIFLSAHWGGKLPSLIVAVLSEIALIFITINIYPSFITNSLLLSGLIFIFISIIIGQDFTMRRKLNLEHKQLIQQEAKWKDLCTALPTAIIIVDPEEHKIIELNNAAERLFGIESKEWIGKTCFSTLCPSKKGECPITDLNEEVNHRRWTINNKNNEKIPVIKSIRKALIDGREVLIESFSDLRELEKTKRKLDSSQEMYSQLFEDIPVPMFRANINGTFKAVNKAYSSVMHMNSEETIEELHLSDFFSNNIEKEYFFLKLKTQKFVKNLQLSIRHENGNEIIILLNTHLIKDIDGNDIILGSLIDITAFKELEDKQQKLLSLESRSRHLDSITKLAGGMAHDINNILAGIHGHAQIIRMKTDNELLQNSVNRITSGVEKADIILQGLLTSIGSSDISLEETELSSYISETVENLRKEHFCNYNLKYFNLDQKVMCRIDKRLIYEMVLELTKNAFNASTPEQEVLITTGEERPSSLVYNFLEKENSPCACLSVIDQGTGISEEIIERIFEPYFTTENFGKGAGLGLSKVYGIIQKHSGAVGIKSTKTGGTSFSIFFPKF